MKILLLQLPIQSHDFFFSRENIPLAPAYMKTVADDAGMEAELLPGHLMSYGSDEAILKFLTDSRPDLVGMSCYLWNVERSLFLARKIKERLPQCRVILGGPEITPDSQLLRRHRDFDAGIVGEGERTWGHLLRLFPRFRDVPGLLVPDRGEFAFTSGKIPRIPISSFQGTKASPYLLGTLDSHLRGVLWLETVRGCIWRCSYCYYHKQSVGLHPFPLDRVLQEVRRAFEQRQRGLREIVFLDPCFARRPEIEHLLDGIAAINHDSWHDFGRDYGLKLYAESTLEGIDQRLAERMARAGFVRIEAGLQSINHRTLRRIHRSFRPRLFLDGYHCLRQQGIEVMVDLIVGLPGDMLPDICKSLDWVLEQEACDSLMLYPLSLIPGTELKLKAKESGLVSMPHPPYLLTRGPGLTAEEMRQAFLYYEECMGEDISPLEAPVSLNPEPEACGDFKDLIHCAVWLTPDRLRAFGQGGEQTAYAMTVRFSREILKRSDLWVPVLKGYLERNPFSLLSVEVPYDVRPEQLQYLWELARGRTHPCDRDYTVTHTPYRSFVVFSRAEGAFWKWPDPREFFPLQLDDGQRVASQPICLVRSLERKIPVWLIDHVKKRYPVCPEFRLW